MSYPKPNKKDEYFFDGEYMETTEESIYKYKPEQRYQKAVAYMQKYFGLTKNNNKKGIPALCFDDGSEFYFDKLEEVLYGFPFGRPQEHFMLIANSAGTLFAYGNGQITFARGHYFRIGDTQE